MTDEREAMLVRVREMRDMAQRSRRIARTVPTPWVIDTLNTYARELEEQAADLEQRADGGSAPC